MMWAQGPVPDEGATVRSQSQHPRGVCVLVSVGAERGLPHAGHMEERALSLCREGGSGRERAIFFCAPSALLFLAKACRSPWPQGGRVVPNSTSHLQLPVCSEEAIAVIGSVPGLQGLQELAGPTPFAGSAPCGVGLR